MKKGNTETIKNIETYVLQGDIADIVDLTNSSYNAGVKHGIRKGGIAAIGGIIAGYWLGGKLFEMIKKSNIKIIKEN